jgi:hypothetical protein
LKKRQPNNTCWTCWTCWKLRVNCNTRWHCDVKCLWAYLGDIDVGLRPLTHYSSLDPQRVGLPLQAGFQAAGVSCCHNTKAAKAAKAGTQFQYSGEGRNSRSRKGGTHRLIQIAAECCYRNRIRLDTIGSKSFASREWGQALRFESRFLRHGRHPEQVLMLRVQLNS